VRRGRVASPSASPRAPGLLKPAGESNTLAFTGYTAVPTVVRARIRAYDVDLASGNLLEPEMGGLPVRTTSATFSL
jgi:hypothetical protein